MNRLPGQEAATALAIDVGEPAAPGGDRRRVGGVVRVAASGGVVRATRAGERRLGLAEVGLVTARCNSASSAALRVLATAPLEETPALLGRGVEGALEQTVGGAGFLAHPGLEQGGDFSALAVRLPSVVMEVVVAPGFWMVAVEQAVIRQVPGESLASDRSARNSVGTT